MAITARYPNNLIGYNTGQIYDFSQIVNGASAVSADLHNKSYVEIVAIESELGTNVSGSQVDLKTRLSNFLTSDGSIDTIGSAYLGNIVEAYDSQINLEFLSTDGSSLELGDVVVCSTSSIRGVERVVASNQYHRIAGIISEAGPITTGNPIRVCINGYATVKVDGAGGNPISVDSLLTIGTTNGRAVATVDVDDQNVFGIVVDVTGYAGTGIGTVVALINVTRNISAYSGSSGTSGFSGYSGTLGSSGYSGFTGTSGMLGYSGYSGQSLQGVSGTSGTSGYSGVSGYSGTSGASGVSGASVSLSEVENGASGVSGYSGAAGAELGRGQSGTSGYSGIEGSSGYVGYSGSIGQYSELASANESDAPLSELSGGIDIWSELGAEQNSSDEYVLDDNYDWRDRYINIRGFYKEANKESIDKHLPGGDFQNNIVGSYNDSGNLEEIHSKILGGLFYSGQGGEGNPNTYDKANLYFEDQSDDGINKSSWQIFVDENYGSLKIKISSYHGNSWVFLMHVQASPKQNHYS